MGGVTSLMTPPSFLGDKFFVRSVYPILFRAMIEDMKEMFTEKRSFSYYIRITGTPGMGKTTFIGFCFQLLRRLCKVFARIHPNCCVKGVPGKDDTAIRSDLQMQTETVHSHIFDYILLLDADSTRKPSNAHTVIFASPDVCNTAGFSSNRVHSIILMLPWEKEELWHCLRKANEKSDRDAFDKCFERWDGSIDFHRNSDVAERKLQKFLQSEELFCFVEEVGNSSLNRMIDTHKITTNFQAFYFQYPPKEDQYRLTKDDPLVEFPSKQL